MTEYTLEREYKIYDKESKSKIIVRSDDSYFVGRGIVIDDLTIGKVIPIDVANALAHAILHCITDIQHFQAKVEEKLQPERIPDRDGWIEHDGKGKPLPDGVFVEVEFRDGGTAEALQVSGWHSQYEHRSNWIHKNDPDDIMRYKVVEL